MPRHTLPAGQAGWSGPESGDPEGTRPSPGRACRSRGNKRTRVAWPPAEGGKRRWGRKYSLRATVYFRQSPSHPKTLCRRSRDAILVPQFWEQRHKEPISGQRKDTSTTSNPAFFRFLPQKKVLFGQTQLTFTPKPKIAKNICARQYEGEGVSGSHVKFGVDISNR